MIEGSEPEALRAIRAASTVIQRLLEGKDQQQEQGMYVVGVLQSTLWSLSAHCFTGELKEATDQLLKLLDQV